MRLPSSRAFGLFLASLSVPLLAGAGSNQQPVEWPAGTVTIAGGLTDGSVSEAEVMVWQDRFALATTAVEERYPDAFAGAEITGTEPPSAVIRFVGAPPPDVQTFLVDVPSFVQVSLVPGDALSSRAVDEVVTKAHHSLMEAGLLGDSVSSFDRTSGSVTLTAELAAASPLTGEETLMRLAPILEELKLNGPPVSVEIVENLGNADEQRTGGGRLERDGFDSLACTSGFNVRNSSGTEGVATAGHCSNDLTHENSNGATEFDINHRGQHQGDYGDFQWGTTSDNEPSIFRWSSSDVAEVNNRGNAVVNQGLCRYGRKTGRECTSVADVSVCSTVDGTTVCRLVRMHDDTAEGGDSGGPWYSGNTAYGFHKGQVGCGLFSTCDVYSKVTLIDDALNVTVQIN